MKNSLPDFFIVGAAKAGTTSLFNYLEQHPSIFLPKNKEPKYFVSKILDFPQKGKGDKLTNELMVKDFNEYLELFNKKKPYQICGEASVDYLYYSEKVIPLIKQKIKDPKIIILLRDPVKRSISAYKHLIRDLRETESFQKGLDLEEERIKSNYEFIWHYKKSSLYYDSVKNYMDSFTNVKVIIFEEFIKSPQETTKEVFSFLGLDDNFIPHVDKKYNFTGKPKNKYLQRQLKGSPNTLLRKGLKMMFNEHTRKLIREKVEKMNVYTDSIEILPETEMELSKSFKEDKAKIENLLNIKLNHWT